MRYRVLGPLCLIDGDRDVTPPGDRQRRLLSALVLERGSVVSADRLAELLWPDRLPADQASALQTHIFRLRRVLPEGAIETVGAGYRLGASPDDLDAHHFGALVSDAISIGVDDPRGALARLDEALALWRGEPYEDLAETDAGRIEAARLRELHVVAREQRFVVLAALGGGDAGDALADLVAFVAEHPLRERPCELLMAALHARGRTAEASRAYDDFRRRLADELGLSPSPELQALHERIVSGAPRRAGVTERRGRSTLPLAPNALVGRDDLVATVVRRLGDVRLVTLIGPGGVGKTRIAGETARRIEADGSSVWFCELAPADSATVDIVVAESLAVEERAGTSLRRRITDTLAEEEGLLVLDNCEHVLDAASALVDEVLRRCAGIALLVTSRERLAVEGEHLAPVAPFSVSEDATDTDPAVDLFAQRAGAVAPHFMLDEHNLAAVVDICRRLDGLPLAIELAAARLQAMEIEEVASGLDQRFGLLTTGTRTAPRQRSLAAAISWSYDLLDPVMRRAFDSLGVFAGPFPVQGALRVAELRDVATLASLVERSLVQRTSDGRFVLLESLKAFATERLAESGRLTGLRRRHAAWVLEEVERCFDRLAYDSPSAFDDVDALLPEMRAAHRFMFESGDADGSLRLVLALGDYAFFRMRPEVLAWGEAAAELGRAIGHRATPTALALAGLAAWKRGDLDELARFCNESIAAREELQVPLGLVAANIVGVNALVRGQLDEAERWFAAGLDAHDAYDNPIQRLVTATDRVLAAAYGKSKSTAALTAQLLADIPEHPTPHGAYAWHGAAEAVMADDPVEARRRAQRSLDEAEVTGAWFVTGIAGTLAASIDARQGDVRSAVTAYRWLLPWWRRAGEWSVLWTLLRSMAILLERMGRYRPSAVLLAAVLAPGAGHEVFGDDAVRLADLKARLEPELGDDFTAATEEGAALTVEEAAQLAVVELDAY